MITQVIAAVLVTMLPVTVTSCPSPCSCVISDEKLNVNCTYRNLSQLPENVSPTSYNLYINNNNLQSIAGNAFENLTFLSRLDLSFNRLQFLNEKAFANLPQLYLLFLQNNNLQFIAQKTFENLPNLWYLFISNNNLQSIEQNTFANLSNLNRLELQRNNISFVGNMAFYNMPTMRKLCLNDNNLQSLGENTFAHLTGIIELYLQNNSIRHIGNMTFHKTPNVRFLNLQLNPLRCDCSIKYLWTWLTEHRHISTGAECDGSPVTNIPSTDLDNCTEHNIYSIGERIENRTIGFIHQPVIRQNFTIYPKCVKTIHQFTYELTIILVQRTDFTREKM